MTDEKVRKRVIKRDNIECQFGKMFGVFELTGARCDDQLEVHHKTYRRYDNEEEKDLITVCRRCHEALTDYIRRVRYSQTQQYPELGDDMNTLDKITYKEIDNGDFTIQVDRNQ